MCIAGNSLINSTRTIIIPQETDKLLVNPFSLFHAAPQPMAVDSSSLLATQAPPDMLLGSEEGEKKASPTASAADVTLSGPSPMETTPDGTKDSEQVTEKEGATDGGVVKKEELIEKEPSQVESSVESSTKSADEVDPTSASADSEAVEAMETDSTNHQAGTGDSGDGGDHNKSSAGDSEPSASVSDGATVSSESQQPPLTDSAENKDAATNEGGEVVEEAAKGGEQVNVQEGPLEVEEEKGSSDTAEAPKEEDEGAVASSPPGEEPVISEPVVKGESVEGEGEGEGTTQEGEEQQQQVCTCIFTYIILWQYTM